LNVNPQTVRPETQAGPEVYLPKAQYKALAFRNRPRATDYDRQFRRVNLNKLAGAKSTSKKQRKYFSMIHNYQSSLQKSAFEKGFFKAALHSGADPMLAYQMYKHAADQMPDPAQADMAAPPAGPAGPGAGPMPPPAPPMGQAGPGGQMDSSQHSANIAQLLAIIQKLLEQQKGQQAPQSAGLGGLDSIMGGAGGGMPGSLGDSPDAGSMGGADLPPPPSKPSKGGKPFPGKSAHGK
jgi:hypothetical protein